MNPKQDIKIVRLSEGDVRASSDHLRDLQQLIHASGPMYPGIEKWFQSKVLPGIRSQDRAAFVGYVDDKPVVSAVAKKGEDSKICHLKIAPEYQNSKLGEVFWSLMGIELRQQAKSAHFTLPESLWETKHDFFESFGFEGVAINEAQYRLFDEELRSSTDFSTMWDAILAKIPKLADMYSLGGFSLNTKLLFSIQPQYSQKIMRGEKRFELRRKFSERWRGSRVNIYETAPTMALVGEALIHDVIRGGVEDIWVRFSEDLGCTKAEFDAYAHGLNEVYAIELDEVKPYRSGFYLGTASAMLNEVLRPPQSYFTLERGKPWAQAVSLAAYIHGCIGGMSKNRADQKVQSSPRKANAAKVESLNQQLCLML